MFLVFLYILCIVLLIVAFILFGGSQRSRLFFVCLGYRPSPSVHSGKSRLSATAWVTVHWPRICPTSQTVWSEAHSTCIAGFS